MRAVAIRCASPSVVLAKLLHADSWERLWTSTGHHGDAQITAKYKGFQFFSLLNQVNDSLTRIPDLGITRDH